MSRSPVSVEDVTTTGDLRYFFELLLDVFVTGWDSRVYTSWWADGYRWSGQQDNWKPIGGFFPTRAPISGLAPQPLPR